jgi:predicted ABC-type ATPase
MNDPHKPELIVIAGPNGSGKTSVTQKFLHHEWSDGTTYINPDDIAKNVFGDWNSQKAVIEAANYCAKWREKCLNNQESFVFETVFSAEDKVDFLIRAKRAGFFVRLFFISTNNPQINAARIAKRVMEGGHDVPISKIVSRYYKSIANCITIAPIIDRLYVYDNSIDNQDAQILFRFSNGQLAKKYTNHIPEWASDILAESH